jgi:hypothetical protein
MVLVVPGKIHRERGAIYNDLSMLLIGLPAILSPTHVNNALVV